MKKYQIIKVLGDGTYGTVYEAINKETGIKVAIKTMKDKMNSLEECLDLTEVKALRQLNHKNIVKLKELIREPSSNKLSLIFEHCDCNLLEFMEKYQKNKKLIPEQIIIEIIYQILSGLSYLHSKNFMHRDLKPENILLILNEYDINSNIKNNINKIKIKIADFGTVKEVPKNKNNDLTDYVSTRWYRAPECILQSLQYSEKIDIWAVGCVLAELYNLKPIFPGKDKFDQMNKIICILGTPKENDWKKGYELIEKLGISFQEHNKIDIKKKIKNINDYGIELLNVIFQYDEEKRPSCDILLNYNYFKSYKNPKIIEINNRISRSPEHSKMGHVQSNSSEILEMPNDINDINKITFSKQPNVTIGFKNNNIKNIKKVNYDNVISNKNVLNDINYDNFVVPSIIQKKQRINKSLSPVSNLIRNSSHVNYYTNRFNTETSDTSFNNPVPSMKRIKSSNFNNFYYGNKTTISEENISKNDDISIKTINNKQNIENENFQNIQNNNIVQNSNDINIISTNVNYRKIYPSLIYRKKYEIGNISNISEINNNFNQINDNQINNNLIQNNYIQNNNNINNFINIKKNNNNNNLNNYLTPSRSINNFNNNGIINIRKVIPETNNNPNCRKITTRIISANNYNDFSYDEFNNYGTNNIAYSLIPDNYAYLNRNNYYYEQKYPYQSFANYDYYNSNVIVRNISDNNNIEYNNYNNYNNNVYGGFYY